MFKMLLEITTWGVVWDILADLEQISFELRVEHTLCPRGYPGTGISSSGTRPSLFQ